MGYSFYLMFQRRSSAKNLSCNDFKQKKRLMWRNPYAKTIHALLLVHSTWPYFFKATERCKAIDYVPCVTRYARTVIKLIKLSRIGCTKNQKMFIFLCRFIGKIYLQDGDISWREFSLSAF